MSSRTPPRNPPRLAREGGEAGRLLRSAEVEFHAKLDESGAFRSIERLRRRRAAALWTVLVVCGGAAAAVFAGGLRESGREHAETSVTAEALPPPLAAEDPPQPARSAPEPAARVTSATRPISRAPARAVDGEDRDEAGCKKLRVAGHLQRAVDCYLVLAGGVGVGAEVASFEAARITAEKLGDTGRALRLLDEHTARFPAGALRAEARWLRVQCLERAGRFDEALSESEAMLVAAEGRALAPDLHWLRARIYADSLNDCQRAVSELVSFIGEPDARGDEAELRRAACLERLGRTGEARVAYEKYLARPKPQRAEVAQAKLEALRPRGRASPVTERTSE